MAAGCLSADTIFFVGDTAPRLSGRLTQDSPAGGTQPVDLTDSTLSVRVRFTDGSVIVRPGAIDGDPVIGRLFITWQPGDLTAARVGRARVWVTMTTGPDVQTFRPDDFWVRRYA